MKFGLRHLIAKIVALEPVTANFELFKANTAGYPSISYIQAGVWPRDNLLDVKQSDSNEAYSVFELDGTGDARPTIARISAISVPTLKRKFDWRGIDILKVDIEGAGYELFAAERRNGHR